MPERIPIIDHPLHTVTVGRVTVHILHQTAGRSWREAVRITDLHAPLHLNVPPLLCPTELADLEAAARQAREWYEEHCHHLPSPPINSEDD